jgi:hypothetical protein
MSLKDLIKDLSDAEAVLAIPGRFLNDDHMALCLSALQLNLIRVFNPQQTALINKTPARFAEDLGKRNSKYAFINTIKTPEGTAVMSCCTELIAFILHAEEHFSSVVICLWESVRTKKLVVAHFDSMERTATKHRDMCATLLCKIAKLPPFEWVTEIELHPYNHKQLATNCGISALAVLSALDGILSMHREFPAFGELCSTVSNLVLRCDQKIVLIRIEFREKLAALRTCLVAFSHSEHSMPLHGAAPLGSAITVSVGDLLALFNKCEVSFPLLRFAIGSHFGPAALLVCSSVAELITSVKTDALVNCIAVLLLLDTASGVLLLRSHVAGWTLLIMNNTAEMRLCTEMIPTLSAAMTGRYALDKHFIDIKHSVQDGSCCALNNSVSRIMRILESLRWYVKLTRADTITAVAGILNELSSDRSWLCAGPVVKNRNTKKHTTRVTELCEQIATQLCFVHHAAVQQSSLNTTRRDNKQQQQQPALPLLEEKTSYVVPMQTSSLVQAIPSSSSPSSFANVSVLKNAKKILFDTGPSLDQMQVRVNLNKQRDTIVDSLLKILKSTKVSNNPSEAALSVYTRFCISTSMLEAEEYTVQLWALIKNEVELRHGVRFFATIPTGILVSQWPMLFFYDHAADISDGFGVQYHVRNDLYVYCPGVLNDHIEEMLDRVTGDDIPTPVFCPVVVYALSDTAEPMTTMMMDSANSTTTAAATSSSPPSIVITDSAQSTSTTATQHVIEISNSCKAVDPDQTAGFFHQRTARAPAKEVNTKEAVLSLVAAPTQSEAPQSISIPVCRRQATGVRAKRLQYEIVGILGIAEALQLGERHGVVLFENEPPTCAPEHLPLGAIPCLSRSNRNGDPVSSFVRHPNAQFSDAKQRILDRVWFFDSLLPAMFLNVKRAQM